MSNSIRYSRRDAYVSRLMLSLFAGAIAVFAAIELAVALDFPFTRMLIGKAMIAGSMLWAIVASYAWLGWFKKSESIWCALIMTIIAEISVLGNYLPILSQFTLALNAGLAVMFLAVIAWAIPQVWRDCGYIPDKS